MELEIQGPDHYFENSELNEQNPSLELREWNIGTSGKPASRSLAFVSVA
jgi:hypothetical protein